MFEKVLTNICSGVSIISEQRFGFACIEREYTMKRVDGRNVSKSKKERCLKARRRLLGCIALAFVFLSAGVFVIHSSAKGNHQNSKCYTSVQVQSGDSLWSIAKQYQTPVSSDIQENVDEIKRINHIQGDEIQAGDYLTIPYYLADAE